ncbi:MAG: FtsQ-type POTRA domain-containing protein [Elusimicrobiota bacterium]|jgi:cell division septal protein FtsQ|nr:FtsQ-type POTRA domain-containing protein [Elusimicrobiota bacterium]
MRNKNPSYWQLRKLNKTKKNLAVNNVKTNKSKRKAPRRSTKTYRGDLVNTGFFADSFAPKIFKLILIAGILFFVYIGIVKIVDSLHNLQILKVKDIEIVGLENIPSSKIKSLIPISIGGNTFDFDLSQIEQDITANNPEIKEIDLSREIFDGGLSKIKALITERAPEAFVLSGGSLKGTDSDNRPFVLYGQFKNLKLPIINSRNSQDILKLLAFIDFVKHADKQLFSQISQAQIIGADITFIDTDGTRVYWGQNIDGAAKEKIEILKEILQDAKSRYGKIEYIDMTNYLDARAIIKPYK